MQMAFWSLITISVFQSSGIWSTWLSSVLSLGSNFNLSHLCPASLLTTTAYVFGLGIPSATDTPDPGPYSTSSTGGRGGYGFSKGRIKSFVVWAGDRTLSGSGVGLSWSASSPAESCLFLPRQLTMTPIGRIRSFGDFHTLKNSNIERGNVFKDYVVSNTLNLFDWSRDVKVYRYFLVFM